MGRAWLLGALLAGWLSLAWAAPAMPHSALEASTPAAGESVAVTTDRLVLVFGEELAAGVGQVAVSGPDGGVVRGALEVDGDTAEVGLALTAPGPHTVRYRFTSADGHAVEGGFSFRVTEAGPADPTDDDSSGGRDEDRTEAAGTVSAPVEGAAQEVASVAVSESGRTGVVLWPWLLGSLAVLALALGARLRASR